MLIVDKNFEKLNYGYWCNSCGELHFHGQYDLEEQDLPHELRWVYRCLWGDVYHLPCYLMDMAVQYKEYGLAFVVEYDDCTAEDCGIDEENMETDLFKKAVIAASRIEMEIDMDKVIMIDANGFCKGGWCIVVFIPANELLKKANTRDKLQELSKEICNIAY